MVELQSQLRSGPEQQPLAQQLVAQQVSVRRAAGGLRLVVARGRAGVRGVAAGCSRRAAAAIGSAIVGLVAFGPAAAADVNVTPAQSQQGAAAELTFEVRNDRPGLTTEIVEVQFPTETPIGEIYPLSVDGWAPSITYMDVDAPISGIHSSNLTVLTSAITWTRAAGAAKPPEIEKLRVSVGPMPQVDELVFTVLQGYSDGQVRRWSGPTSTGNGTVVKLAPAAGVPEAAGAPGGHAGAGGHGAGVSGAAVAGAATNPTASASSNSDTGADFVLIFGGVTGGLVLGAAAAFALIRRSQKPEPTGATGATGPTGRRSASAPKARETPLMETPTAASDGLSPTALKLPTEPAAATSEGSAERPGRGGVATATRTAEQTRTAELTEVSEPTRLKPAATPASAETGEAQSE